MKTVARVLMGIITTTVTVFKAGREPTVLPLSTLTFPEPKLPFIAA